MRAAPATVIRSLTLTQDTDETLQQLSREASDFIGRTISGSAIVRALLRQGELQDPRWARAHLFPLIETELAHGFKWGSKR